MPDTFYSGPGWQQSSEPYVTRKVHLDANDDTDIVWPEGGNWDTLTDGEHPILAIGRKANRPKNITGVVVSYDSATDIATFNLADKYISKQYVANISGYDGQQAANAWQNTVYPGDPVYVDDSNPIFALGIGVTLSFAHTNGAGSENPLAGYVWWCQDEFADSGVAGPNSTQGINQPAESDTSEVLTLCVMQVNDHGMGAS